MRRLNIYNFVMAVAIAKLLEQINMMNEKANSRGVFQWISFSISEAFPRDMCRMLRVALQSVWRYAKNRFCSDYFTLFRRHF